MQTIRNIKKKTYIEFVFSLFAVLFIMPLFFPKFSFFVLLFINLIYLFTDLIKTILFAIGVCCNNISKYYEKDGLTIKDEDLPIYTILLPVRKEKEFVLNNLLHSIYNLEYPKNKLDIKLIVDNDDNKTISVAKNLNKNFDFDLVIVPTHKTKSKPISCNYALNYAKGKFLTIYDAEDRPEKYQLRKAVEKFNKLDSKVICLQASLNYYNKYTNFLSYCFSIEYSMWFDFTIHSINKFTAFFPLGGTSNHFKTEKLIELGGWDGYNMTEDAEISVRIVKAGYKIFVLNSITEEECPITIQSWLKQRTRWFKGFMQTFCEHILIKRPIASINVVNNKKKFSKISNLSLTNIMIFHIFISMSFFFFISLLVICYNNIIFSQFNESHLLNILAKINIILLIIITYVSFIVICVKNHIKFHFKYFIFFPFYWCLHYIAGIRALYYLITTPFYWSKTEHGVIKIYKTN